MSRPTTAHRSANPPSGQRSQEHVLSPIAILRHSAKLSGANLLSVGILFPINILVAGLLGPEMLGVVGFIALWQFYASLSKTGMSSAASREVPPLLAQGRTEEAVRVLNIGIAGDAVSLLVPIALMVGAAVFQNNDLLRAGLLVGAVAWALGQVKDFAGRMHWAQRRFGLMARVNVAVTLVSGVFTLATVWWLKVFTPLLAPAVSALAGLIAYRWWGPPVGFRWEIDRQEMWRLVKIGVPLGLLTISYWAFRSVDRTMIAIWLPLVQLGYFTFAVSVINFAIARVTDFGNVLEPTLWAEMGRHHDPHRLGPHIRKLTLFILALTCAGVNFAQAAFGTFVYVLLPRFGPSVATFEILVFLLACTTAAMVPETLLTSVRVNRQKFVLALYGCGVLVNAGFAYLAVRAGWGIIGIALSSVVTQLMISAALLAAVREYLFQSLRETLRFYISMAGLLLLAAGVSLVFQMALSHGGGSTLRVLILRLLLASAVWGTVIGIWYQRGDLAASQDDAAGAAAAPRDEATLIA